jgi:hypothetical protein
MEAKNCRLIGHLDIPGGGQVVAQGKQAFIGHIKWPHGTSIVDVSDLKHPRLVSTIETPEGTHRHKVRVRGDIMMVNVERLGKGMQPFQGGLKIYDISKPEKPLEIAFFKTGGKGVHRSCGGQNVPQSNDVFIDDQGLIYLIDRYNGLDILEFTGSWS